MPSGSDLLPSDDLPEIPLDLRICGDDDRRRAALDEWLDRRHDAAKKFEQFFLADLVRVVTEGLRLSQPSVTTYGAAVPGLLVIGHSAYLADALRQIELFVFAEFPPRPMIKAGVFGADRQQPEGARVLEYRKQRLDVEMVAEESSPPEPGSAIYGCG